MLIKLTTDRREARLPSPAVAASPPHDDRHPDAPALDDREIDAIVAFLGTLTDARYRDRLVSARAATDPRP
jgi:hypothetical protein